jgi:hypothetical protein
MRNLSQQEKQRILEFGKKQSQKNKIKIKKSKKLRSELIDTKGILSAWYCGVKASQIARDFNCSRQYVSIVIAGDLPSIQALGKQREEARSRLRKFVRTPLKPTKTNKCRLCGALCLRAYCCPAHYRMAMTFRFYLNDEAKRKHNIAVANRILKKQEGSIVWANNMLFSPEKIQKRGRWFVDGSKMHKALTLAIINKWPILDSMGEDLMKSYEKFGPYMKEDLHESS